MCFWAERGRNGVEASGGARRFPTDEKAFFAPMDGFAIGDLDGAIETITTEAGQIM